MNIPDSIVEQAASESFGPDWTNAHPEDQRHHRNEARKILNTAAPFIAAQALRDALDVIESVWVPENQAYGLETAREAVNAVLRERENEQ